MAKQSIEQLVEGGKATAAPPLGPALGPLGVNIGQVISEINKKTAAFKGMQVPVKIIVDTADKSFLLFLRSSRRKPISRRARARRTWTRSQTSRSSRSSRSPR